MRKGECCYCKLLTNLSPGVPIIPAPGEGCIAMRNETNLFKSLYKWLLGICIALFFAGCANLFYTGTHQYAGTDSLSLPSTKPDILDIIAEVGKSMGYTISKQESRVDRIELSSSGSMFSTGVESKISEVNLTIIVQEGGTKLDIYSYVVGDLGPKGWEAGQKIVNDFKAHLLWKIRQ